MGNATEKFGRVDEIPGGHKVIHRTAQAGFVTVVTPRYATLRHAQQI